MFSGTTVKDTWTKPRGTEIRGESWGGLGEGEEVGVKGRKLDLNNNRIKNKTTKSMVLDELFTLGRLFIFP